ncbi:PA0069 family radical SAM protein [Methylocapsa aurea]|uniref:PA0069 family radical SAM protein n=1 Tax=Methylocapsa aurea TaxID=663610 RepID=UPI000AB135BD|nr:PA0069 family radical SAM protein [Methylocapsa aurea]
MAIIKKMADAAKQDHGEREEGRPIAAVKPAVRSAKRIAGGSPRPPAEGQPSLSVSAPNKQRGRGALSNESGRFESETRYCEDDGWGSTEDLPPLRTQVTQERAKTIITRNDSPDISFDRSINPYRGCEHGCVYCFARPTHAYLGFSPGLDFETRLFAKTNAASLLERELSAPNYRPKTIAIGANTDPYQPIERKEQIMRQILGVLARTNHPVGIVTKSALVLRDLDLLVPMAEKGLVKVALSVTTLDPGLARKMEPRASAPARRLETIRLLAQAGVPTVVMVAPIIPAINDAEIETILTRAHAMGAREAGYVMLRLPLELRDLFTEWLLAHYPDKLRHVLALIRSVRGGKLYDSTFGKRMAGSGPYAWMIGRRFEAAAAKIGLARSRMPLRCDLFSPPARRGEQLQLL